MNPIMGTIYMFAGNFAPAGFAMCNGELLPIIQNQALFSIIGTTYGGDGIQDFALPKLTAPDGASYIIATQGVYPR
jgi:microcystin-dependent protein